MCLYFRDAIQPLREFRVNRLKHLKRCMKREGNGVEADKWRAFAGISNAENGVAGERYKREFEGVFEFGAECRCGGGSKQGWQFEGALKVLSRYGTDVQGGVEYIEPWCADVQWTSIGK
jgi:hypothetical protein